MEKLYILFELDHKVYAINIDDVLEVTELENMIEAEDANRNFQMQLTPKGEEISLINLRAIFGLDIFDHKNNEVIIIEKENRKIGLMIDKTLEIKSYNEGLLKDPPSLYNMSQVFLKNIISIKNKSIRVLDIDVIIGKTLKA